MSWFSIFKILKFQLVF